MSIVNHAREFAIAAHGTQQRRYDGNPYWHHLRSVAEAVAAVPGAS